MTCEGFCIVGPDSATCGCGPGYQLALNDMQSCIGMYDGIKGYCVKISMLKARIELLRYQLALGDLYSCIGLYD